MIDRRVTGGLVGTTTSVFAVMAVEALTMEPMSIIAGIIIGSSFALCGAAVGGFSREFFPFKDSGE